MGGNDIEIDRQRTPIQGNTADGFNAVDRSGLLINENTGNSFQKQKSMADGNSSKKRRMQNNSSIEMRSMNKQKSLGLGAPSSSKKSRNEMSDPILS